MPQLELLYYPDKRLRRKAQDVTEITPEIREGVAAMFEVMYRDGGVGLAAPQVNWNVRIFIMNVSAGDPRDETATAGRRGEELVLVNPVITETSGHEKMEEGCLSFPGIFGRIERAAKVTVEAKDLDGQPVVLHADGLMARCILHELDHLDGVLFIDRLSTVGKIKIRSKLQELEAAAEAASV